MFRLSFLLVALVVFLLPGRSHAQFWKKKEKERTYTTDISEVKGNGNTADMPFSREMRFTKKKYGTAAEGIKRAQELQEANAKKYRKMARDMETDPRYNDPGYFGHKKKPKKNRPGKKKFCKQCGIVH
jgi:hypothetical protein